MKCYLLKYMYLNDKPKLIGAFSTTDAAWEAVDLLAKKPGFRRAPGLAAADPGATGFLLAEFTIDEMSFRIVTPKAVIRKRSEIYLLEHHYTDHDATLIYNSIGVFSSPREARQLAVKLKKRPEFARAGEILEPSTIGNGFRITPMSLDTMDWTEGFLIP